MNGIFRCPGCGGLIKKSDCLLCGVRALKRTHETETARSKPKKIKRNKQVRTSELMDAKYEELRLARCLPLEERAERLRVIDSVFGR